MSCDINKLKRVRIDTFIRNLNKKEFIDTITEIKGYELWHKDYHISEKIKGTIDEVKFFLDHFTNRGIDITILAGENEETKNLEYSLMVMWSKYFINIQTNTLFNEKYPPALKTTNIEGIDNNKVLEFIKELDNKYMRIKGIKELKSPIHQGQWGKKYVKIFMEGSCTLFIAPGNKVYRSETVNRLNSRYYHGTIDSIIREGIKFDDEKSPYYLANTLYIRR